MAKKRPKTKKSRKDDRYCGECGRVFAKKISNCPDCENIWEEFEKPYRKIPFKIIITLCMCYILTFLHLFFIVVALPSSSREACYLYLISTLVIMISIYATLRAMKATRSGFVTCRNCKRKTSLKAKFCIYCGNRLIWA